MAFQAAKDSALKLDDSGGTLRDISAYVTNVDFPQEAAPLESTVFGKAARTRIAGLKDASVSIQGNWDSTVTTGPDAILSGIVGKIGSFEFGPEGSTTGKVKYSGEALCTSYRVSAPVDGIVSFTAELLLDGAVTRGTFA